MLNGSSKSRHPSLVPDLGEALDLSSQSKVPLWAFQVVIIKWGKFSSIPGLLNIFLKGRIMSNAFSVLIEMVTWFLSFILSICLLIDFWMFSPTCIPRLGIPLDSGVNPIWSWSFLYVAGFNLPVFSWVSLCYIHKRHWSVVFHSCDVFGRFWYHGNTGLIEWVGNFFFISAPQLSDGNSTLLDNAATLP